MKHYTETRSWATRKSIEAIVNANLKVDRAIKAGAMAVGADVEIDDMPGYLPLLNVPALDTLFKNNVNTLSGEDTVTHGGDFTGSFDFGDISHIMPALPPFTGGVEGSLYTREFKVTDPETACLLPAKALAMTLVDLLWDNAKEAGKIIDDFKPAMTKEQYLSFLKQTEKIEFYTF